MTHTCVGNLTTIGSDNGFVAWRAPGHYLNQCWNIVNWTTMNKLQWNLNQIHTLSFKKMNLKISSAKWWPFCLSLNVLTQEIMWHSIFDAHHKNYLALLLCLCSTILTLLLYHDDAIQWKLFSTLLVICTEKSRLNGEFPAQRPVMLSLMFSLICAWINGWVNNREAGDLRCHHAHDDITVMLS